MLSLFLLFFPASGIFEPLEVALNRSWNCSKNRHYFTNQLVGLGLIFACGVLMVISTMLTTLSNGSLPQQAAKHFESAGILGVVFFRLAAIPLSMFLLFLVYWLLPQCTLRPPAILPAAIRFGFLREKFKYIY